MAIQPVIVHPAEITAWATRLWWPALRISGFVLTAPISSSAVVPTLVKILVIVALAVIAAPFAKVAADLAIFSGAGVAAAVQELLIGIAIGTVVQLAFDAVDLAGQTISMTMGLGFSTLIDPQRGANSTVLSQLFVILATLSYLAMNGHLVLVGVLVRSFDTLPVGVGHVNAGFFWSVASWGGRVFESGILIALPAVVGLVIVNMALGVVTRAAPQLNLFGIGFPITMLAGYFVLIVGVDGAMAGISTLIDNALMAVTELVMPAAGAH